ncbi:MAG: ATP-binding cassette domain-containing protein [Bacilli bacterium]
MDIDEKIDDYIDYKTYKINEISCKNVTLERAGIKIIDSFTYTFIKGSSYCIYGDNGSGKTTLLDIMIGLYNEQYSGTIKYNGVDIKKINMNNIRHYSISLLEQYTCLINGQIKDNIFLHGGYSNVQLNNNTFQNPNVFINMHLDKVINDYNNNISGGELQKIGIVRLLSKNASVFILDEPTNSLDPDSINLLKKYISHLKVNNIVIIVNHDPLLMEMCDCKIKI